MLIFLTIGLSVKMVPLLKLIPMPVLFGVFLYMGVASLNGIQFFDRILLFFMPKKFQPDVPYLRKVQLKRVHLFTAVQLASLGGLWVIKDVKQTSILFPVMVSFPFSFSDSNLNTPYKSVENWKLRFGTLYGLNSFAVGCNDGYTQSS